MYRLILIYICLSLELNVSSQEVDYKPFLKEVAQLDTLFTYAERNDTLFLLYGEYGQRIELFKNRLTTITPLNKKGQINGVRVSFKFYRKISHWPEWFLDQYSDGEMTSKDVQNLKKIYLSDLQTSQGDSALVYINTPKSFSILNDSLNKTINSWRISEIGMPHQLRLEGKDDSIMTVISFQHGYFHIIGTYDLRRGENKKSIYVFDFGKLIFKLNLTGNSIIGSHKFYFKGKEYDFECLAENYECYCTDSEIATLKLSNPNSKYFYIQKTFEGNEIILSSYTYYTLLKFEI